VLHVYSMYYILTRVDSDTDCDLCPFPYIGSLVLVQLLALSVPYFITYGYVRMVSSKWFCDRDLRISAPIESFAWFYLKVLCVWDVRGVLSIDKSCGNTLPLLSDPDIK